VDAILSAAEEMLVSKGLDRTTTNRIAERAGVSVGTLYQYFDDKEAVFDGVASRFTEALAAQTMPLAGASEADIATQLQSLLHATAAVTHQHPGLMTALQALPSEAIQERMTRVRGSLIQRVADWIRAAGDRVAVKHPEHTARHLMLLIEAHCAALTGHTEARLQSIDSELHRLLDLRHAPPAGTPVSELPTPCLVLDQSRLDSNLARMRQRADDLGVQLRPHIKTTKSAAVATHAVGPEGPLTVSTLREAEYFAAHGFTDLTYAVAIIPDRLDRVAAITASGVRVALFVESVAVARALVDHPGTFDVFIELDCGEDRTGVQESTALLTIATLLHSAPRCVLRGVATHGGHSYGAHTHAERAAVAEQERRVAVEAAETLRQAGVPCPEVSVGSTPTAVHAAHLTGVTEMRPGVYTLGDLFQAGIGSHTLDDIACSVLATVLSHRRAAGTVVIDAGGLALSKDRSTAGRPFDADYGLLADAHTGAILPGLRVASVHQEHGMVTCTTGEMCWDRLPVGSRVRVLPNHICMTAAMYGHYHVVLDGRLETIWRRTNGW